MNTQPDQQPIALRDEFEKLWRRKFLIIGFTVVVSILAIVLTMRSIMLPEYKSVAAFIPPGSRELMSQNYNPESFRGVGSAIDEDLDRFAGLLNSDSVRHLMAEQFDLYRIYEIPTEDPNTAEKEFTKAYEDMISVSVSKWSMVEIEVYDKSPQRAQLIAQAHLDFAEAQAEKMSGRKANLQSIRKQIKRYDANLQQLNEELAELRENYGVYNLNRLSDVAVSKMGGKLYSPGFHNNYDQLLSKMQKRHNLSDEQEEMYSRLNTLEAKIESNPDLISIVKHPVVNLAVARPKRMMIVLFAFVGALLLSTFAVLLFDATKKRR